LAVGGSATLAAITYDHYKPSAAIRNDPSYATSHTLGVVGREVAIQAAFGFAGKAVGLLRAARAVSVVPQVVSNGIRGRAFEAAVINALGGATGSKTLISGTTLAGDTIKSIPDMLDGKVLTEIKDVKNLSYSKQLQAQLNYAGSNGLSYRLIINMSTKLTGPLENAVRAAGGTIQRFDVTSGTLHPY